MQLKLLTKTSLDMHTRKRGYSRDYRRKHPALWDGRHQAYSLNPCAMQSMTPLAVLGAVHLDRITDLSWSADGLMLAASSYDGFCRWRPSGLVHGSAETCSSQPRPARSGGLVHSQCRRHQLQAWAVWDAANPGRLTAAICPARCSAAPHSA